MTTSNGSKLIGRPIRTRAQVFAIRHGETVWSRLGRHTGLTDIPLTESGREAAKQLEPILSRTAFDRVLSSPLERARATCELAGFAERMEIDADLVEWNYGEYEGLTPEEIEQRVPGWMIFSDGCPGGEMPAEVGLRVDRVIAKIRRVAGHVALFAHGHLLRVLAARWLGFPPAGGSRFLLDTSTLSILSYYRDVPTLKTWNTPFTSERLAS
jgi:probable phosphoglycerate mutase